MTDNVRQTPAGTQTIASNRRYIFNEHNVLQVLCELWHWIDSVFPKGLCDKTLGLSKRKSDMWKLCMCVCVLWVCVVDGCGRGGCEGVGISLTVQCHTWKIYPFYVNKNKARIYVKYLLSCDIPYQKKTWCEKFKSFVIVACCTIKNLRCVVPKAPISTFFFFFLEAEIQHRQPANISRPKFRTLAILAVAHPCHLILSLCLVKFIRWTRSRVRATCDESAIPTRARLWRKVRLVVFVNGALQNNTTVVLRVAHVRVPSLCACALHMSCV